MLTRDFHRLKEISAEGDPLGRGGVSPDRAALPQPGAVMDGGIGYLEDHGKVSRIHRKKPNGQSMPLATARVNAPQNRIQLSRSLTRTGTVPVCQSSSG